MKRAAVLLATGLLAACEPAAVRDAKAAEQRLELVKAHGTLGEACTAARDVRDAWLKALDQDKYKFADLHASGICNDARMYGDYLPADDRQRAAVERAAADGGAAIANAGEAVADAGDAVEYSNATDPPDDE